MSAFPRRPVNHPCCARKDPFPPEGGRRGRSPTYGATVARHRAIAGGLASFTIVLAAFGETLALAHVGGAIGLFLLVLGAASGIAAWVALGAPRTRTDMHA